MTLRNKIEITDPIPEIRKYIKETLTLPNPLWQRLKRMGNTRALYGCPKDFKYYEESKDGRSFRVGRGTRSELEQRDCVIDDRTEGQEVSFKSTIVLREYQEGIVEEVTKHREGIIKLGTGFGKTIIALNIAETLGLKTLIIVPRLHIKAAFEKEIEQYFGFDPRKGTSPIEVRTLQTLQRCTASTASQGHDNKYGLVIVDEAHTTVPQKSRQVIESFAPKYLYGMTATPRRTDGQGNALGFMYGKILVDKALPRKSPTVKIIPYANKIEDWDYPSIIKTQTQDPERNSLIARIVEREASRGRRCLVLTKRIEHYELILDALRSIPNRKAGGVTLPPDGIIALRSEGTATARALELDDLRSGRRDFSILLSTFSLAATGVDIPSIDVVCFAGDLKSDVLQEQGIGRCLRILDGKPDAKVIDIVDTGNPILKRQGQLRRKFYMAQGWKIEYGEGS